MSEPEAKPLSLIVLILIACAFCIGSFLGKYSHQDKVIVDLSAVYERDSIIAQKELKIGELTNKVNERDSIIVSLVSKETAQRDTVFTHLEDKFEGAPDSTREALINEALNAIQ